MLGDELVENLVTWVYEEGSYVPVAKIQNGERYTIISDYMGRPVEAYNSYGNVVWQADYDIYGDLRNIKGIRDFIPFHQLGSIILRSKFIENGWKRKLVNLLEVK